MNKKVIIILSILVALIVLTILTGFLWYHISLGPVGKDPVKYSVEIPIGSTTKAIADQLKEQGMIHNRLAFCLYVKMNHISNLQAGNYEISKNMSVAEITELLQTGKVGSKDVISITFLEGKNMRWVARNNCESYQSFRRGSLSPIRK